MNLTKLYKDIFKDGKIYENISAFNEFKNKKEMSLVDNNEIAENNTLITDGTCILFIDKIGIKTDKKQLSNSLIKNLIKNDNILQVWDFEGIDEKQTIRTHNRLTGTCCQRKSHKIRNNKGNCAFLSSFFLKYFDLAKITILGSKNTLPFLIYENHELKCVAMPIIY